MAPTPSKLYPVCAADTLQACWRQSAHDEYKCNPKDKTSDATCQGKFGDDQKCYNPYHGKPPKLKQSWPGWNTKESPPLYGICDPSIDYYSPGNNQLDACSNAIGGTWYKKKNTCQERIGGKCLKVNKDLCDGGGGGGDGPQKCPQNVPGYSNTYKKCTSSNPAAGMALWCCRNANNIPSNYPVAGCTCYM